MAKLPQRFCEKMKNLLQDEYDDFIKGYDNDNYYSLRVNTLKGDIDSFTAKDMFCLSPVEWCPTGFYYDNETRPGRHQYHHAGVYYIQEASAMAPVASADIQPGDKVLDLCAAPGGKSTQAACRLGGTGLLVSNEIVPSRAKILSGNMERMGVKNAIVLNENPANLEKHFPAFFDKIIVDAPCSGEGMFRKDDTAIKEWSEQQVDVCANRQSLILESAHKMLAPGGKIVYSTCTFAPEENEMMVAQFISNHPEYRIVKPVVHKYFSPGRPQWADGTPDLADTMRLFPHLLKGEGHYVAVLEKTGGETEKIRYTKTVTDKKALEEWYKFEKSTLKGTDFSNFYLFGTTLYSLPDNTPDFSKLKVLRAGLQLGEIKKGRFEPSHSLAMALKPENVVQCENLPLDDDRLDKYLTGSEISTEDDRRGWRLISVDGYSTGWGKSDGNVIKNHYPKGLRIMK
ncbi:MAG: RsmB/NOP family class I SAM-dependent RNA methyltransferase [Oscillospiraceae bacterium]|nr:RsmB/NOP family class I SAM-dependent RNA methyltransferase [Oscillospiraceae bacterium]